MRDNIDGTGCMGQVAARMQEAWMVERRLGGAWSRRALLGVAAALPIAACATTETAGPTAPAAPSPAEPVAPSWTPVANVYPRIIDTSTDVRPYLAGLKAAGVQAIFRYYALQAQAEVPEKQLTQPECDAILDAGFSIGSVFQYYSNRAENIQGTRGRQDGGVALERAAMFGQTAGSCIYFGVDFDWLASNSAQAEAIRAYFTEVSAQVKAAGYRVGVYGSGNTCRLVLDAGLADLAWLVNSPGHAGAAAFYNSKRWRLFQNGLDTKVAGRLQVDTNLINPAETDFGQWSREGAATAISMAASAEVAAGRRFVARHSARLYAAADAGSAVVANTRFGKGRTVRLVGLSGEWAQVDVNESGAASGYCRVSDLTADLSVRPDYADRSV